MRVGTVMVTCVVVVVAAGCQSETEPVRAANSPVATTAAPLTSSASERPITRKAAGEQYLRWVSPLNAAITRCNKHIEALTDGAGPYLPESKLIENVRTECARALEANEAFAEQLESGEWPEEAQQSIRDLAIEVRGASVVYNRLSKSRTIDDVFETSSLFPQENQAADIVRARLGLPLVGEK